MRVKECYQTWSFILSSGCFVFELRPADTASSDHSRVWQPSLSAPAESMETLQIPPNKIHFNFWRAPLSSSPWGWCHLLNSRFRTIMLGHSVWRLKLLLLESCCPAPGPIFITSPSARLGDISYCDRVQPSDPGPQNTIILLFSFLVRWFQGRDSLWLWRTNGFRNFLDSGRFLRTRKKILNSDISANTSWHKTSTKSKRKDKRKSLSETTLAMFQKVSACHQIAPDQTRLNILASFWEHLTLVLILNNPSSSLIYLQFDWIHSPK